MTKRLQSAARIVIKIGSALLVEARTGALHLAWLEALAEDIAALLARGKEVVVVSSGAIALGRNALSLPPSDLKLEDSQAAAAVGQVALAHAYQQALADRGLTAAQILLTLTDTEQRRRYLNARGTLNSLLRRGAVPVVNENDTVATSEIRYGDNDRLAARVAGMIGADCLVLLSDVDGLYTAPPDADATATLIPEVTEITPEVLAMAGSPSSAVGSGGMVTKLEAARIATAAGAHMVITSGRVEHPIARLEAGCPCTWFLAAASPTQARKTWIAGTLEPCGSVIVDDGAVAALRAGKSLLPAGVTAVRGAFARGDAIAVMDTRGGEIARGLSAYDWQDASRIVGHKSGEIERILGYRGRDEIIHRDDMVLTGG